MLRVFEFTHLMFFLTVCSVTRDTPEMLISYASQSRSVMKLLDYAVR